MINANREIAAFSSPQCRTRRSVFPPSQKRSGEIIISRFQEEPKLSELLSDPILHLLLKRDGVSVEELHALIEQTRRRRQATRPRLQ